MPPAARGWPNNAVVTASAMTTFGVGIVELGGASNFTGFKSATQGLLEVAANGALGTTTGLPAQLTGNAAAIGLTVQVGAALELVTNNMVVGNKPLTLNDGVLYNSGCGSLLTPANVTATWQGNVIMPSTTRRMLPLIDVPAGGYLTLQGVLSGTSGFTKFGCGSLELGGTAPNTLTGNYTVAQGNMILNKSGTCSTQQVPAVAGTLVVGDGVGNVTVSAGANVSTLANQVANTATVYVTPGGTWNLNLPAGCFAQIGGLTMTGGTVLTGGLTAGGNIQYKGCLIVAGSVQYITSLTENLPVLTTGFGAVGQQATIAGGCVALGGGGQSRGWTIADGPAYYDLVLDAQLDPSGQDSLTKGGTGGLYLGCAAFAGNNFNFGTVTLAAGNLGVASTTSSRPGAAPRFAEHRHRHPAAGRDAEHHPDMPACFTGGSITLGGRRDLPGLSLNPQPGNYTPSSGVFNITLACNANPLNNYVSATIFVDDPLVTATIAGNLTGNTATSTLTKAGYGCLVLGGYVGNPTIPYDIVGVNANITDSTVTNGILVVQNSYALGNMLGNVNVAGNAALVLNDPLALANGAANTANPLDTGINIVGKNLNLYIGNNALGNAATNLTSGYNNNFQGSLINQGGNNSWVADPTNPRCRSTSISSATTGSTALSTTAGAAFLGAGAGCLVLDGVMVGNATGTAATGNLTEVIKVGPGTIEIRGNYSDLYQGNTVVLDGTLNLNKGNGAVSVLGNLFIGDNVPDTSAADGGGAQVNVLSSEQIYDATRP